jgi:hypothetical protein
VRPLRPRLLPSRSSLLVRAPRPLLLQPLPQQRLRPALRLLLRQPQAFLLESSFLLERSQPLRLRLEARLRVQLPFLLVSSV